MHRVQDVVSTSMAPKGEAAGSATDSEGEGAWAAR